MKKILILLCGCLFLLLGVARSQTFYVNMPDTVCMSTNSGTADQVKFTSMNAMLASGQQGKPQWTLRSSPSNTGSGDLSDFNILYSEVNSADKATQLGATSLLTLQFLRAGRYTFRVTMVYKNGNRAAQTVTRDYTITVVDCTISTCSGGDAVMPGFKEDFGVLPANTKRMSYSPSSAIAYVYNGSTDLGDNNYAIMATTKGKGDWIDAPDHTGNTRGGMLVANSSTDPRTFFQKQVDNLCRGSVYNFSAWFINTDSSQVMTETCRSGFIYAGVTFEIVNAANTNQILASFRTFAVSPNFRKNTWQRFGGTFTVPTGVSSVVVRIKNNFPGGCGNDIAVDDIEFSYCSPIITAGILGSSDNLKEVLCEGVATTLVSSYTPKAYFTNPEYQWEMSDDGGVSWFNVPFGTSNKDTLVIKDGELKGTKNVAADYLFRVRIFEAGSSAQTCAAPSSSIKLTILPMPQLYLTQTRVCEGSLVDLQASGGYDYFTWSDLPKDSTDPNRTINLTKDTTIKVFGYVQYSIDNKICIDSNTASIKVDDKPTVEVAASATSVCVGNRIVLTVNDKLLDGPETTSIKWYRGTSAATGLFLGDWEDQTSMMYSPGLNDTSFVVVVTRGACEVESAPFKIKVTAIPAPVDNRQVVACVEDDDQSFVFPMSRTLVAGTTGQWQVIGVDGPALNGEPVVDFDDYVYIPNKNNGSARITISKPGVTVYLQWTVKATANNDCVGIAFDTLTLIKGASMAWAGDDQTQCGTTNTFTLDAQEVDISQTGQFRETGVWRVVSASVSPVASIVVADASAYNTNVTLPLNVYQDVVMEWSVSNVANCGNTSDTVILHYTAPPTLTLKPDTTCTTTGYFDLYPIDTIGRPTHYTITGSMPGFTPVTDAEITVWPITVPIPTDIDPGIYPFNVSYRSGEATTGCTGTTTVNIYVEAPPVTPTSIQVSAPDICTTGPTTLRVIGGSLPKNADGTDAGNWEWYAGADLTADTICGTGVHVGSGEEITVTVDSTTTFYVRAESAHACGVSDCVNTVVTVWQSTIAAEAGPNQAHCNDSLFTLSSNIDTIGTGKWTLTRGKADFAESDTSNLTPVITVHAGDTAVMTWTLTNGACISTDTVVLINYMQPVAAVAGTTDTVKNCNNAVFSMTAATASPATAQGTWTFNTGSTASLVNPSDLHNPAAQINVPIGDSATAYWTVTNGLCSSVDSIKLYSYEQPAQADAGVDLIEQCETPTFNLTAMAPNLSSAKGKWSVASGPATFVTDSTLESVTVTLANGNNAMLYWTITNGTCVTRDSVYLRNYSMPAQANAGPDSLEQCNNDQFTMQATAASPAPAIGKWSTFTGSAAILVNPADSTNPAALFRLPAGDTATVTWTVSNGVCSNFDRILLKNYVAPTPANAGLDSMKCDDGIFHPVGNQPTPVATATGVWTLSNTRSTITGANTMTPTITVPAGDSVIATWTITNGTCTTSDDVKLVNYLKPDDANAGPDQHQCDNDDFTMAANAPSVATAAGYWTKPVGSTATIITPNSPTTHVTVPVGDSSMLFWTITNGVCVDVDTVWVVNNLRPATAAAGDDIEHCNDENFLMTANSPGVAGATGTWSVVSPVGYTIPVADVNDPAATFVVPAGTTAVLRWTITNLGCTTYDDITLINNIQPTGTTAGPDQEHCNDSSFVLNGSAVTVTGAVGTWYRRSAGGTGNVVAGEENLPNAHVIVPAGQTAVFHWVITNGTCADSAAVTITNYMQPVAAVAGTTDTSKNCDNSVFTMTATAASPATAAGTWTFNTGSTATLVNPADLHNPAAQINVPIGDSATAYWTVTNGLCSTVDSIKLYSYEMPAQADAGGDLIEQCETPTFNLTAVAPSLSTATAKWSVHAGNATFVTDSTQESVTVTVPNGANATLYWTITNGACSTVDSIHLVNYSMPAQANAGPDSLEQCNIEDFTMQATAASPAPAIGKWSTFTGSAAILVNPADSTNPAALFRLPAGDTATVTWTVSNGVCYNFDRVLLKNYEAPTPADAGPDSLKCDDGIFHPVGNQPTPVATATGVWTLSNTRSTITGANTMTPMITVPAGDSVIATWTITNGTCTTSDDVKLVNYLKPDDANAGPDQHQCDNDDFTMAANAPSVATAAGYWTKPVGSTATIITPNSPTTHVTVPVGDSSMLFWTITNGVCVDVDTVWVVNNLRPATAAAGDDIEHCNDENFLMTANSPGVAGATGTWSVVSPVGYTIPAADANDPAATFVVPAGTTAVLRWTITNLGCTTYDDITLTNYIQPTGTTAGPDQEHCNDSSFVMDGSAVTVTGAVGTWYRRSADGTGNVVAGEENLPNAHVIVPAGQTAVFHWVITNGTCADSAAVTITNYMQPVAAVAGTADTASNCDNSVFTMTAIAASPATAEGTWTFNTGSTATLVNPADLHNPAAQINVPIGDSTTAYWTVTNGLCSTVDSIKLYSYELPAQADAGTDLIEQCETPTFNLTAVTPSLSTATAKWSVANGPATFVTDSTLESVTVNLPNGTNAMLYWTITNGTCETRDSVYLVNYAMPAQANAGPDSLEQCNIEDFTMQATAASPAPAIGKWSTFTGSAAILVNPADSTNPAAIFRLPAGDTATLTWTVSNGVCSNFDRVLLKNYEAPTPADAGPDSLKCDDGIFHPVGNQPTPVATATGVWTLSNTRSTITGENTMTPTITVPAGDSVIATWTITNGTCTTADDVKLVNYLKPDDANAGPDQHQCDNDDFTMAANAPSVPTAAGYWTKPVGSTANIIDPTSPTTHVTIPVGDSSMLFWTITNGVCVDVDTVMIANNNPPADAAAGDDISQCNNDQFVMVANTPSVSDATGTWTVVSPAGFTIPAGTENDPGATFTVPAGTTVVLRWTITNLGCTSSDDITLINYEQPTAVSAGTDESKCAGTDFQLNGSPVTITGATGTWYVRSTDASGNINAAIRAGEEHLPNAHVTVPNNTTAELHWVVTNGLCADSAAVFLTNFLTPVKASVGVDSMKHCNDSAFVMVANAADVAGSAGNWTFILPTTAFVQADDTTNEHATIIVPAGDSAYAIWTIGNGTCSTSDTIKLVNYMAPTAAAVPADMQQCMNDEFPVTANAPDVPNAFGTWKLVAGNGTFPNTDLHNNSTTFTVANGDSAYFSWTLTNGICESIDTIRLYNYQQPVQADAGVDSMVQCNTASFIMNAVAASPAPSIGKWSLYPGSAASFTDSTNIHAEFTLPAGDTATAIWTVTNGVCSSYDTIFLKNYEAPAPTDAGPDSIKHCNDEIFNMTAAAPSLSTAYGVWTLSNPNAIIAPADTSNPLAVITVPAGDSVIATWTVKNGTCATSDVIKLVNYQEPTAAAAGADARQCATAAFTMTANTPDVTGAVGTWTLPATTTATITAGDEHKPDAVINVPVGVTVTATWTITNGVCTSSSDVILTNDSLPDPAAAGPAQVHCNDSLFIMAGNTPSVTTATGLWTLLPGSAAVITAGDENKPDAHIIVLAGDTATAIWTITNGECATSSRVFLQNDRMPEDADAGTDQTHCNDSIFHLAAVPGLLPDAVGTWEVVSGTTMDPADIHNPNATVHVAAGQTAVLRWTLGNGTCTGNPATVTLINQADIIGNTISANQLLCENSTPAPLTGTATLDGGDGTFTYQWQMSTTSASTGFANVSTGTGGTAATYQPAALTMATDTIWFRRLVTSGVCANSTSNVVMLHIINQYPVVTKMPDSLFVSCVLGKDYTTLYTAPNFSHSPFNGEALTLSVQDVTITNTPCLTQIKRIWTATDRCGLATPAEQVITIRDTSAPKFTTPTPVNVTVDCDKVPAIVNLQAYDSCGGAMAAIAPIEVRRDVAGQCSSNYTLIRKWVAVDGCGNASDTLYQYITVQDTTRPVFTTTVPPNVTVDCNSIPTAPVMTATDNCTPGTITATVNDVQRTVTGACAGTYTITRTWTALDNCGNTATATQVITVQDRTKPTIQTGSARDTLVDCDKVIPIPALVFTDNCNPNPTVTFTETKVNLSTTCTNNYQLIRTWVASDGCNDTTVIQRVTVQDTTKPTFTVPMPGDTTVSCGAIPKPLTALSATDNCGTVTIDFKETRETNTGACAGSYRIIRVYTATDNCRNALVHRQVITVVDTTAPVIDVAPANVTVQCGGSLPAVATLYATDNCDGNFPRKATMTVDPYTVDICNGYTITRRWNIADQCGNAAIERVQIITVEACPKPTLDANLPLNCSDNTKFALQLTTKVSKPKFTLQSVYPAGAVSTPLTQTSNIFDLKGATQATFIVTDGVTGCVSDPVTYNLQYLTRPVVNLGTDVDICRGSTITLDAGAANVSAGYAIMWNTGATTQQITVSTSGTYSVTVTNQGCSTTSTVKVTVNEPPVVNLRDTTICENTSVKLSAYVQGASYAWSTGETTSNITVSAAGTYTVDVSLKGCTVTAQSTVFVATPPVVQLTPDTAICPGGSVTLRVEPDGGTVKWSDNSVANTISVSRPGTYWVTVTKNSCVVSDTVKVGNKGNITFDLGPDKDICAGGLVVLSAQHADVISYLWNDGTTDPVKEVSTPGKYSVTVLERFCNTTLTDSVNVTVAGIEPFSLGNDTTICMGQTLTLKVDAGTGNSVRWQDNSTNETFVVSTAGYYTVTVYNDCGSLSDDITVTYKQCETTPTFPNAFTPNGDGNNDKFRPHVNGPMYDYDLRVFNRWGQIVWMSKDATSGWDGRNHGTLVDVGTYVYLLTYKSTAGGQTIVVKGEVTVIR